MILALVLAMTGCEGDLSRVPGTTVRVGEPTSSSEGKQQLRLHIFNDRETCATAVGAMAADDCVPWVDRRSGQVRVAFQVRVDGTPWPVPLGPDDVEVFHKNQRVTQDGRKKVALVPHDPTRGEQLFILMIDDTYSMGLVDPGGQRTRLEKVQDALLRRDVVESFFPKDVKTAVVPLLFRGGRLPEPLSPEWVVRDPKEYRRLIREGLRDPTGYTPLYEAIEYSATSVLEIAQVKQAVQVDKQQPTVIVLTDGFNNPDANDTCASNAPRLKKLLDRIQAARLGESVPDVRYRPTVFTVGLGRKAWRQRFDVPSGIDVTAGILCGNRANERVDGGLELYGVDNRTLAWVARVGGGASFVSNTTDGLADAFKAAAAMRYGWFEARYQVDPFYLRRAFETKLRLVSLQGTSASLRFFPSAWLDAPSGEPGPEGWTRAGSFFRTFSLLMPLLAFFAAMAYLPAAMFNVRRAMTSRVTRRKR